MLGGISPWQSTEILTHTLWSEMDDPASPTMYSFCNYTSKWQTDIFGHCTHVLGEEKALECAGGRGPRNNTAVAPGGCQYSRLLSHCDILPPLCHLLVGRSFPPHSRHFIQMTVSPCPFLWPPPSPYHIAILCCSFPPCLLGSLLQGIQLGKLGRLSYTSLPPQVRGEGKGTNREHLRAFNQNRLYLEFTLCCLTKFLMRKFQNYIENCGVLKLCFAMLPGNWCKYSQWAV